MNIIHCDSREHVDLHGWLYTSVRSGAELSEESMWGRVCVAVMIAGGMSVSSPAQRLFWQDSLEIADLSRLTAPGQSMIRLRITQQVDYSLTLAGALFINWTHDSNENQVMLLQDLAYQCNGETTRRFQFSGKLAHHLGLQYFFDSVSKFHVDDNQLETRLSWRLWKTHGGFLSSLLSTRIFKAYKLSSDTCGNLIRSLNSSFLTPLTVLFSGGLRWNWPLFGSLNIGLTSAKLTWIRDKRIYNSMGADVVFGVPQEKRYLFEYGVSLHLLVNHDLFPWLHWDCDLLVFKNTNLTPDVSIRNNLGIRLAKFLRARIQTRIYYEERLSKKVQLENMVSVGFVMTL